MTLTATLDPFHSPFLNTAEHVYPKCPLPTSSPTSSLLVTSLEYPNLLSSPAASSSSPSFPSSSTFFFLIPLLRLSTAAMCFAGDGGALLLRCRGVISAEVAAGVATGE
ncbi:hypothetical protein MLD38_032300 [Melastoma candidum]|uniref:Uncharacterized protein n=1 Tax=Melastoma candidum TaxID=119954 RepID=A0ACB9M3U1_9MYRT|nr:hypothetical protein MLD38_032300 [Melastoma candidum]